MIEVHNSLHKYEEFMEYLKSTSSLLNNKTIKGNTMCSKNCHLRFILSQRLIYFGVQSESFGQLNANDASDSCCNIR